MTFTKWENLINLTILVDFKGGVVSPLILVALMFGLFVLYFIATLAVSSWRDTELSSTTWANSDLTPVEVIEQTKAVLLILSILGLDVTVATLLPPKIFAPRPSSTHNNRSWLGTCICCHLLLPYKHIESWARSRIGHGNFSN